MIQKLLATKRIYDIVVRAIAAREQSGVPRNDTLQMLLDMKDEKLVVVGVRPTLRCHVLAFLTASSYSLLWVF
jgi:hypothetical protein